MYCLTEDAAIDELESKKEQQGSFRSDPSKSPVQEEQHVGSGVK